MKTEEGVENSGREGWGQKDRFLAAGSRLLLPQRSSCPPRFSPVVLLDDKGNAQISWEPPQGPIALNAF